MLAGGDAVLVPLPDFLVVEPAGRLRVVFTTRIVYLLEVRIRLAARIDRVVINTVIRIRESDQWLICKLFFNARKLFIRGVVTDHPEGANRFKLRALITAI